MEVSKSKIVTFGMSIKGEDTIRHRAVSKAPKCEALEGRQLLSTASTTQNLVPVAIAPAAEVGTASLTATPGMPTDVQTATATPAGAESTTGLQFHTLPLQAGTASLSAMPGMPADVQSATTAPAGAVSATNLQFHTLPLQVGTASLSATPGMPTDVQSATTTPAGEVSATNLPFQTLPLQTGTTSLTATPGVPATVQTATATPITSATGALVSVDSVTLTPATGAPVSTSGATLTWATAHPLSATTIASSQSQTPLNQGGTKTPSSPSGNMAVPTASLAHGWRFFGGQSIRLSGSRVNAGHQGNVS